MSKLKSLIITRYIYSRLWRSYIRQKKICSPRNVGCNRLGFIGFTFCLSGAQSNTIPEIAAGRGFTGRRQNTCATGGVVRQKRGFLFFGLLRADPSNCLLRCSWCSQIVRRHPPSSFRYKFSSHAYRRHCSIVPRKILGKFSPNYILIAFKNLFISWISLKIDSICSQLSIRLLSLVPFIFPWL